MGIKKSVVDSLMQKTDKGSTEKEYNIIEIGNHEANEFLRIESDGRIFWKQCEVETNDEFRAAMLELKDALIKGLTNKKKISY